MSLYRVSYNSKMAPYQRTVTITRVTSQPHCFEFSIHFLLLLSGSSYLWELCYKRVLHEAICAVLILRWNYEPLRWVAGVSSFEYVYSNCISHVETAKFYLFFGGYRFGNFMVR